MTKQLNALFEKAAKLNEVRKDKTMVFILSTMRSGSTLLKSLLANAPDTSYLPEVNFQKYVDGQAWKLKALTKARIVILKKPAPFDQTDYPQIPRFKNHRKIILVRDVYETVASIKKMNQEVYPLVDAEWSYERLVHQYWYTTYKNLLAKTNPQYAHTLIIRYEDLLDQPLERTKEIFHFMGSVQKEGVDRYASPKNYQWKWGVDDGGQKIKLLKVEKSKPNRDNTNLLEIIQSSTAINQLRKQLGYVE